MAGKSTSFIPLTGLRVINWYAGVQYDHQSYPAAKTTDARCGIYGATVTSGGAEVDARHVVRRVLPVFATNARRQQVFTMTHQCLPDLQNYDASGGARCKDRGLATGMFATSPIRKQYLRLINTHSLAEVFINSDGVLTLGEGERHRRTQTIGSRSGLL